MPICDRIIDKFAIIFPPYKKMIRILLLFLLFQIFAHAAMAKTWKIMPLGDSITDGIGSYLGTGGYRDDLYQFLTDQGINFDFVGSLNDGISPDPDHEGHDGFTAEQIDSLLMGKLVNYSPDIILLHIGTNNIGAGENDSATVATIEDILDKIHNFDSQIHVIFSSLIPQVFPDKDSLVDRINYRLRNLFYRKLAEGYQIRYAGNNEIFKLDENWAEDLLSADGFHPNDAGYHKMAQVFSDEISNIVHASGISVTDNFNRNTVGVCWVAPADFHLDGQNLIYENTVQDWSHPALYAANYGANDVSIQWAPDVDSAGVESWGVALMMDGPSTDANGYLLVKHFHGKLSLWTIVNGSVSVHVGDFAGNISHIGGGDVFRVKTFSDENGHHFLCYLNGNYDGMVSDSAKLEGNGFVQYAGIMAKGQNVTGIDAFNTQLSEDIIPPSPIADLSAEMNENSVLLSWTATGDDWHTGRASFYDIRYSTVPITESNFYSAQAVSNPPIPSESGTTQNLVISGLNPNTTYYFAVKVADEVHNISALSNIIQVNPLTDFPQWEPFEMWFTRQNLPSNPYLAEPIFAHFISPGGQDYRIEGFWESGSIWGIRFCLTQLGEWNYTVFEKDSSVVAQGTLECTPSDLHGFLKVDPQHPHKWIYSDGTPFYLMGDTNWDGMTSGVDFETRFKPYIDQRSSQGFTNLNLIVADDRYDYSANEGGNVFYMPTPTTRDYDKLNPAYFDWVDKRVSYANEHGIIPSLFFSWSAELEKFSDTQIKRYIRYLVARYAAYKVIWVLTGEMEEANSLQDYIDWGNLVRNKDPFDNPITLHTVDSCDELADQPWLTFIMQQFRGNYQELYDYIRQDWSFNKPVANGEYGYLVEQYVHPPDNLRHDGNYIRKGAWAIAMAGGGFVSGFGGTFFDPDLHYPEDPNDPTESRYPIAWSLNRPQDLLAGRQLRYLKDFLTQKVNYQLLSSHQELTDSPSTFVIAEDDNQTIVVYNLDSLGLSLHLENLTGWYSGEYWDPDSGMTLLNFKIPAGQSVYFRNSLIQHDYVILLKRTDADPGYDTPQQITDVMVNETGSGQLDVNWSTVHLSDTRVEYGAANQLSSVVYKPDQSFTHHILLNGLMPGQAYLLRVSSRDSLGNWEISDDLTIQMSNNYLVRVNCGGDSYTDLNGNLWESDHVYSPQNTWGYLGGYSYSTNSPISGTEDDELYESERYGMEGYRFDVPNGHYRVRLLFAEIYWDEVGRRVFDVDIEGGRVLSHYDIYREVGKDVAEEKVYEVDVTDGELAIGFSSEVDNAKVSGIEVRSESVEGPASVLRKVRGDEQEGQVCHVLGDSIVVRVEDNGGHGVSGVEVRFGVLGGGGRVEGDSVKVSDGRGECGVRWRLGREVGSQRLGVIVVGVDSVEYTAEAIADTEAAVAVGIEVETQLDGDERIHWETGEESRGYVEYGEDTSLGDTVWSTGGYGLEHEVEIGGLARGGTYHYRIHTEDCAGNEWESGDSVFVVQSSYVKRVNCGGESYTDVSGHVWEGDQMYSSGSWGYVGGEDYSHEAPISGTEDDELYESERYGMEGYRFDVPNGNYEVELHFAEIYFHEAGRRLFNVILEDQPVITNLDIFANAGYAQAYILTFNCMVNDSVLNIDFFATVNFPKISAIYVKRVTSFSKNGPKFQQAQNFVAVPDKFEIQQSYPNPFVMGSGNSATRIQYQIPGNGEVTINIFNILGKKIKSFQINHQQPGYYELLWNGTDVKNCPVSAGIYFYQVRFRSKIKYGKIMIIKR